jgi:molybdenum cofactor cytidylyltransferase
MKLLAALRVGLNDVVALTGGGGKTTTMFRLADEIVAAGGQVVTTTTTRIFAAQSGLAPHHVRVKGLPADNDAALAEVATRLDEKRHVLVTAATEPGEAKAPGIALEWIAALQALPGRPAIVVEADGSRMRPFKAPAEYEPVVPRETDLVVPVVGADVFGAPLDAERVHRPERVAAVAGVGLGALVTPEIVANVLAHLEGGLRGVPAAARVAPLINKVEQASELAAARETAQRLLRHDRLQQVVIGAVRREPPVVECWGRVAAIVLAAGRSTRMGQTKQTLPWGEVTVVGEVVRRLQASSVAQIIVVTGAEREAVQQAVADAQVAGGPPVAFAHNLAFAQSEMAWSFQAGLRAAQGTCLAALVVLADQPRLNSSVVENLIARWRETQAAVVAPFYQGRRGHPMLFDRGAWPALMALPIDANPRQALEHLPSVVPVQADDDSVLHDLDTPEAYARAVSSA